MSQLFVHLNKIYDMIHIRQALRLLGKLLSYLDQSTAKVKIKHLAKSKINRYRILYLDFLNDYVTESINFSGEEVFFIMLVNW